MENNRRQKCVECNRWFFWHDKGWGTEQEITCKHCGAIYKSDASEVCEVTLLYTSKKEGNK